MNFYTDELEHAVRERGRRVDTDSSRELQLEAALASSLDGVRRAFCWINKNVNKRGPGKLFLGTARQSEVKALCEHFTTSSSDAQLPDGCTPVGVALAALFLLKKLPRPLISKKTARKLTTAAQESLLRPDYQEVAIYVAKCAVQELRPSTSGNTVSRGAFAKFNIFLLLKGIIRTLREVAEHEHVHGLTAASLAACVGPALTQQTTSTTSGHMGFDICAAIAFLIKNCHEVFADSSKQHSNAPSQSMHQATGEATSSQGPEPTIPAHRASQSSDRELSKTSLGWEGHSASLPPPQAPQEKLQRPISSRAAANQPRKMDNLLTSIAWGPRKTYTAAADEGRGAASTQHQPQRGRSSRHRSRPHTSQSPDSGLGRTETISGHLHRSSSRGFSTSRLFSPNGRKQGGDQEGKPAWKPPGNADRWRWLREKARANSHCRGDDRRARASVLMSASSLNSGHPVCEQGSSGGAKSEASSLNASSSTSDARSQGGHGDGKGPALREKASGAAHGQQTEPDEVSSSAAGQPHAQAASYTPAPAGGTSTRYRRDRSITSRSVSPGTHRSSERDHKAGTQTQSFASIRGALQRLQSLGALRSPSSPPNPGMHGTHASHEEHPNSRGRWDIRSSSIPTYWPATVRHSSPSQAQHSTLCTSPTRIPIAHPVAGLRETYAGARNGSRHHASVHTAGVSPTAAVFAHERAGSTGDLACTPHGTTPPNLAAARQASLQDPLPTLDVSVPEQSQSQLPPHASQHHKQRSRNSAPQPQTAVTSNAVLPPPASPPAPAQRQQPSNADDNSNAMHESPTWGLTEPPPRTVVNAQDTSHHGDGTPELRRPLKKRSSPTAASHRAREGTGKGPHSPNLIDLKTGDGSAGSSSPPAAAVAVAAAKSSSAGSSPPAAATAAAVAATPAPESPPLGSTQPVRSVELLTALANQSLSPWLRSPGSSSKHEGVASRQGSTPGGVGVTSTQHELQRAGSAADRVSSNGTQAGQRDSSNGGTSGSGDMHPCATIPEGSSRERANPLGVTRHTVSSAQRSRSPTAKASLGSSSRRSSAARTSTDGTAAPGALAPAFTAARARTRTTRSPISRTGHASRSPGSPERAEPPHTDSVSVSGTTRDWVRSESKSRGAKQHASGAHSPSRIPTRSATPSPAQSPATSRSPQGCRKGTNGGRDRGGRELGGDWLQMHSPTAGQHMQHNQGMGGGSNHGRDGSGGAAKRAAMQRFALSDESSTIFSFAPVAGASSAGVSGPYTGYGTTSSTSNNDGVAGSSSHAVSGGFGGFGQHSDGGKARYGSGSGMHTDIQSDSSGPAFGASSGGVQGWGVSGGTKGDQGGSRAGSGDRASQAQRAERSTAPEVASGSVRLQHTSASGRLHSLSDVGATSFNRSGSGHLRDKLRGSKSGPGASGTASGTAGPAITGFGRGSSSGSGAGRGGYGGGSAGTALEQGNTRDKSANYGHCADSAHVLNGEESQSGSLCDGVHDSAADVGLPQSGVHSLEVIGASAVSGLSVPLVDANTASAAVLPGDATAHGAVAAVFSGNSADLGLPSEADLLSSFEGPLLGLSDGTSGDVAMHAGHASDGTGPGVEGGAESDGHGAAGGGYGGYPWGVEGGASPWGPAGGSSNANGTGTGALQGSSPGQGSVNTTAQKGRMPKKSASQSSSSWKANALADAAAAAARVRNSRIGPPSASTAGAVDASAAQGQTSVATGALGPSAAGPGSAEAAAAANAAAAAATAVAAGAPQGAPAQGPRSSVHASAEHLAALRQLRASQRKGVRASRTFSGVCTSTGGDSLQSSSPLEAQPTTLNTTGHISHRQTHAVNALGSGVHGASGSGNAPCSHRLGGSRSRPEFEASQSPDSRDSGSANSSTGHGTHQHSRGTKRRKASSSPCDRRTTSASHDLESSDTDSSGAVSPPDAATCSSSSQATPNRPGDLSPVPEEAPPTHGGAGGLPPATPHTPQTVPAAAAAAAAQHQLAALSTLATQRPSSPSRGTSASLSRQESKISDGEDVSMMLPEGVEIDDLIRLAEIVATPGTKPHGGTPAPAPNTSDANSPSQFMRWMSDMLKAGKAVEGANSQGGSMSAAAAVSAPSAPAPSVPGTCDPTANAKQSAAVLAAALARGLQTPVLGSTQINSSVGPTQVAGVSAPPGLQEETSVDTTAKTPQPTKSAPPPPPPAAPPAAKPKPKPAEKKKKDDSAAEPKPPPPPPPPPGKKPGAPPPPPPPPPGKKRPGAPPPPPAKPGSGPSNAPPGMRLVRANQLQRQKLKQLHWDAVRNADGMVWGDLAASTELDVDELERLFKLLDNKALKKVQAKAPTQVLLIEGRRAHNVCIELSGIHMDVQSIKEALTTMQTDHISVDALTVLQRSVPTPVECNEIAMYLAGKHPKYKGMRDPQLLGACERYFMHVMNIPNLAERLSCVLFKRNFGASVAQIRHHLGLMSSAAQEVRKSADFKLLLQFVLAVGNFMNSGTAKGAAQGFKIALLLKLEDIKATDRKTTLLQFCIQQAEDKSATVLNLADDLSVVKQAARLQVTAVETLLTELDSGIKSAQAQVVKACEGQQQNQTSASSEPNDTDGGAAFFAQTMVAFLKSAEDSVAQLRTQSKDTMELLRNLYAYFGERYDGNDPVKILGTLAAFLDLYAKSVKQYRDRRAKEEADAAGPAASKIQIRPKSGAAAAASTPAPSQPPQPAPPEDLNTPEPAGTRQKISVPTTGMRLVPIDPATASAAAAPPPPAAPGGAARAPGGGPPPPPPLPGHPFGAPKLPGGAPPPPPPPPRPFGATSTSLSAITCPSSAASTPAAPAASAAAAPAPKAAPRPPPPPPPLPPLPLGATPAESTLVVDIRGPGGLPTIPAEAPAPQQQH